MRRRWFIILAVVLSSMTLLLLQLCLLAAGDFTGATSALAAPLQQAPTVTEVDPQSGPNDLDTPIVISGTGFVNGATVSLDGISLDDVEWVSSSALKATVPWGMDPRVYTLTVTNPGDQSGSLPSAFEVEPGIDVWNAGQLYGGHVEHIAINPLTTTTLYAASPQVGLFRSRDGAENWSFIHAPYAKQVAIDPITPTTIYMRSGFLLRSDDEGHNWRRLDVPGEVAYPHPTTSGTVYASGKGDNAGLWKSDNYGQTWLTVTTGLTDAQVSGLVFHPTHPLTVVVGTENGNLFRTTDGGSNWTHASQPVQYVQALAFNPFGEHELWVSDCCFCQPPVTLKSTNVDYTEWITVADPVGSTPSEYIVFPPLAWGDTYSNTIFASECWAAAYKSTDGGDNWEDFGPVTGTKDIALHPTNPDIIYTVSDWAGVTKSTDGGATWQPANNGLTAIVPVQLAADPYQPDVLYAVVDRLRDGLYKGTRGGAAWRFLEIAGGIATSVLVDPFTPDRVYVGGDWSDTGLGVYRDDGDETWPPSLSLLIRLTNAQGGRRITHSRSR